MWHKWSLQTRILLGYGLILALAAALALFLVMRIGSLNQDMQQLNSGAAVETNVGIRMTRDVAEVQQAVSRYFQQSQPAQLQAVHDSLRQLTTNIDQIEPTLDTSNRQALLNDLKHQTQIYHNTFESVSRLLKEQEPLRVGVNTHLARAISLLNNTLAIAQRDQRDSRLVGPASSRRISGSFG
jgi:hypothetical protein